MFRYNRLFRELLQAELARDEPQLVPELHRRAADWCEENGFLDEAIDHAEAALDRDRVARLVSTAALSLPMHLRPPPASETRKRRWSLWRTDCTTSSLTAGELRLLPYLATHLSLSEIGGEVVSLEKHQSRRMPSPSPSTASSGSRPAAPRSRGPRSSTSSKTPDQSLIVDRKEDD